VVSERTAAAKRRRCRMTMSRRQSLPSETCKQFLLLPRFFVKNHYRSLAGRLVVEKQPRCSYAAVQHYLLLGIATPRGHGLATKSGAANCPNIIISAASFPSCWAGPSNTLNVPTVSSRHTTGYLTRCSLPV
jgi:hypothetical protein